MKKIFFVGVVFLLSQITFSQVNDTVSQKEFSSIDDVRSLAFVESKPEYPGGMEAFYKHLSKNYRTPNNKNFKGGKFFITFVIEKDGSITDMKVIRDIGFGTGEEAIRVLKMSEKWKPAEQNGQKVRVQFSLPFTLVSN